MKYAIVLLTMITGFGIARYAVIEKPKTKSPLSEITLTPCEPSADFPKAAITAMEIKTDGDSTLFNYTLKDYVLGNQTPDAGSKYCANSAKGQHIHLILNNGPYEAWYLSSFKKKLPEGHYVALSFLSRSYHESIKTKSAYTLRQFNIGKDAEKTTGDINLKQPMIFYSRPKGEYIGNDAKKILLDFYITNTTLSAKGNHVKATIDGKEFNITEWRPFYIEGLPMGEHTLKLELLDKNNKPAGTEKAYQTVERKFTLKDK